MWRRNEELDVADRPAARLPEPPPPAPAVVPGTLAWASAVGNQAVARMAAEQQEAPDEDEAQEVDEQEAEAPEADEAEPEELPEDNHFAYHASELLPDECIPEEGSVAQLGPTAGSMLLFRLPLENTEYRPLELEIQGEGEDHLTFELDI